MPKHFPLLFTFHDKVEGNSFIADVAAHGRALAALEDDGTWWMYGVQPGAIAGSGSTPIEAHVDFRRTFSAVLFDFATEAKDFWAFHEAVSRFFHESDAASVAEWDAAVQEVRAGKVSADELPIGSHPIRQERAESQRFITIERKQQFRAADNALDPQLTVAA